MTGPFPRRTFLTGGATLAAALAALPRGLSELGWLDEAAAAELDRTRDTFNGLVAFVTPGDDGYSVAQGAATKGPGGIAAGATAVMIETLDSAIAAPVAGATTGTTLPASGAVAELLNGYASQVNPVASRGGFVSPFARLSFEEKGEVFRLLDADPMWDDTQVRSLGALLTAFPAFLTFTEAGVFKDGRLTATPVGWQICGFSGPNDGWDEFQGYWGGRRAAANAHRFVRHRHRRRRARRRRSRRA